MALRRRRAPNPWEEDVFETPSRTAPEPRVLEPRIRRAPQVTKNPFGGGPFEGTLTAGPPTSTGQVRRGGLDGGPFIGGPDDWQLDGEDLGPRDRGMDDERAIGGGARPREEFGDDIRPRDDDGTGPIEDERPPIGDGPEDEPEREEEDGDPRDEEDIERDEGEPELDEGDPFEEDEGDIEQACQDLAQRLLDVGLDKGTDSLMYEHLRKVYDQNCADRPPPAPDSGPAPAFVGPFYDSVTPLGAANIARYGVGPTNFESRLRRVLEQRGA